MQRRLMSRRAGGESMNSLILQGREFQRARARQLMCASLCPAKGYSRWLLRADRIDALAEVVAQQVEERAALVGSSRLGYRPAPEPRGRHRYRAWTLKQMDLAARPFPECLPHLRGQ
jgi:hypothetical protein